MPVKVSLKVLAKFELSKDASKRFIETVALVL